METVIQEETASRNVRAVRSWKNTLRAVASSQLLMWLALTFLFAAQPLFFMRHANVNDPDIWWHMRTGEWIVQNHHIPHTDPFSWTTLGRPWVDYCWMFDLGSYWLLEKFDLVGIVWFQTIMRLLVTLSVFGLLRNLTSSFWKAFGVTALAMLAMSWSLPPRPGAFSVLFFVLELYVLVWASRKGNPRWLWLLPILFVFWANLHAEFITGLFVLGVFCLEPLLDRFVSTNTSRTPLDAYQRHLRYVTVACFAATLLNPFGLRLYSDVFQLARYTKIYDVIVEFSAMHFRTLNDWATLAVVMLACFMLGSARRFRPAWVVLLAWAAWMGFRALREVHLIAILSAVVISGLPGEEQPEFAQENQRRFTISTAMRLAVSATVCVLLLAGASTWSLTSQRLLLQVKDAYPVGAVSYIHKNHLQGPLVNEFSWGGFLIYAVPDIPCSMDGRANVHTEDEIMADLALWDGESGWQNNPVLQKANLVVSNHWHRLATLLRLDPRFRLVYQDSTAVVFQAVHAENGADGTYPSGHPTAAPSGSAPQ